MKIKLSERLHRTWLGGLLSLLLLMAVPSEAMASEANLVIPALNQAQNNLLIIGIIVCVLGMFFGLFQFMKVRRLPAHQSMLDVANTIYETCKTYLIQQGKFLLILFAFIGVCIAFYFGFLERTPISGVLIILGWTVIGILGSYSVAWYGIRMNTLANSRTAFAGLEKKPLKVLNIALDAGMSIGVLLVCVELIMMLIILLFVPREIAGASFIGFAIGESLGASALRIAGGIFTKIADIGSDLMKIVFGIKEDDPRNPGVIADCTGDNAGDSVGPTADGFETYGVTGVALVTFIVLGVHDITLQMSLLTWIFVMRVLMVITSVAAFYINGAISKARFGGKEDLDFEQPLTSLVWTTSLLSIAVTFVVSYYILGPGSGIETALTSLWFVLATIISIGTLGAALIPEFTKIFTSPKSSHVAEVVKASREGGASLNILSGLVAGNFSAFWIGVVFLGLMFAAYYASGFGLAAVVGATTMIFSLILVIQNVLGVNPEEILNLLNPYTILGFLCGGAVIYWFTGASTQAVTTGAYRAVEYIKRNIQLDDNASQKAATEKSKEVVKICTQYAQNGMFNIFIAIFSFSLAFACLSAPASYNAPVALFVSYLISIAVFGLFQAVFMANAGGCWDNSKKVVEVDLQEKGTPLHDATVVGDTVGDPFKDTSSVSLNPIIKFTTLFGLLAMEIAIAESFRLIAPKVGIVFLIIALFFVWRSFYGMRIETEG
jgi:Na+/H+-translocating membrane pyrophosphatase